MSAVRWVRRERLCMSNRLLFAEDDLDVPICVHLGPSGIVGQSKSVLTLLEEIQTAALVDASVLILGETGVGKEPVARSIRNDSSRRGTLFLPINCAAIPNRWIAPSHRYQIPGRAFRS